MPPPPRGLGPMLLANQPEVNHALETLDGEGGRGRSAGRLVDAEHRDRDEAVAHRPDVRVLAGRFEVPPSGQEFRRAVGEDGLFVDVERGPGVLPGEPYPPEPLQGRGGTLTLRNVPRAMPSRPRPRTIAAETAAAAA